MRAKLLLLAVLLASGAAHAAICPVPGQAQPLRPVGVAPVAGELEIGTVQLGAASGVLSEAYGEAQAVDEVLLRQRMQACDATAFATPAPGVGPDTPGAYKPKTQYDNTPWRFNMTQNGRNMTADEFSAWMKARGVRVAKGANASTAPTDVAVPEANPPVPAAPQPQAPPPDQQPPPANPPTPD